MNLKTLLCGVAAAAMFTACASDEPSNGPVNPGQNGELVDAGYITVGINLPTVQGSRAENDNFDHGTPNEYAVDNAMLLIFKGDTEDNAVFHSAYDLTMVPGGVDGGDNITTSYLQTVHLHDVGDNDNLWGLVLVNYTGVAKKVLADGPQKPNFPETKPSQVYKGLIGTLTIDGHDVTSGTTTFSTLRGWASKAAAEGKAATEFINSNYFFMTNAVISKEKPGELTQPDASAVYTLQNIGRAGAVAKATEEEAVKSPAAAFYVERAVAKATLTWSNKLGGDLEKSTNVIGIKSIEWVLDNTEKTSYFVRNIKIGDNTYIAYGNDVEGTTKYRFIGNQKIGTTAIQPERPLYRHYWAVDPSYATDADLSTFITANMTNGAIPANTFKETGSDKPQYCRENTFDVDRMNYKNSTRAVLKVTFDMAAGGDGSLWQTNNTQYDNQSYENIFKSKADAVSERNNAILASHEVRDAIKAALKAGQHMDATAADLEISEAVNAATNLWYVTKISLKANDKFKADATLEVGGNLVANINATFKVYQYKDGVAYYDIRFKHFGDEYTPWTAPAKTTTSTAIAYGSDARKYLGRWGMVRNNWYEINVRSIKQLGKPVIGNLYVENDDTPDDNNEVEKWISFRINILSWAKRVQNEDL